MNIIKNDKKLKKYSLCEIMSELKKLKCNCFDSNDIFLSELTKKQKLIFKAFSINIDSIDKFLVINFKFILGYIRHEGLTNQTRFLGGVFKLYKELCINKLFFYRYKSKLPLWQCPPR